MKIKFKKYIDGNHHIKKKNTVGVLHNSFDLWGQGMCMEVEHKVVSEAKYISLVLLKTEETFAPTTILLRCFLVC